jgi:hypothetical protein
MAFRFPQVLLKRGPYAIYVQLGEDRKGHTPKRTTVPYVCNTNIFNSLRQFSLLFWPLMWGIIIIVCIKDMKKFVSPIFFACLHIVQSSNSIISLNEGFSKTCGNYKGRLGTNYMRCMYVVFLFDRKGIMDVKTSKYGNAVFWIILDSKRKIVSIYKPSLAIILFHKLLLNHILSSEPSANCIMMSFSKGSAIFFSMGGSTFLSKILCS